jgi:phage FluMu protein Com
MPMGTLTCEDCEKEVPRTGSKQRRCPPCGTANRIKVHRANYQATAETQRRQARERYAADRAGALAYSRKRNYGLSSEDIGSLWAAQDGTCRVCLESLDFNAFHVDHCHKTGRVRGLLHGRCNTALGMFWDDPAVLLRAADYLHGSA